MGLNPLLLATAAVLVAALAGCAGAPAASPSPSPVATASPTPDAGEPLACDDLVPPELVAATLAGDDGEPVDPVAAVAATEAFTGVLIEGVGGLACSWRVGSGMPEYNPPSDWAYLRVDVLPDAAGRWVPLQLGDAVSTDTREVAGIEASVTGGDPGWFLSAPVGDDWVVASISAAGLTGAGSRFDGVGGAAMIDRLADVARTAFPVLEAATPEQLERPAVALRDMDAACAGSLDRAGILEAVQLRDGTTVEYVATDAADDPVGFPNAVRAAARAFDCELRVDGRPVVTITTAPGFASLFDRFREPDADVAYDELLLGEAPEGVEARAVVERDPDGPASLTFLAVGDALHQIRGERVEEVARAIVARSG
ncbi:MULTISPECIES: hypothetical protein [unclassified Agromyces]|uniref:hypothetical protein n=1 Tax=unclassified Agromyces TaxID=2639701 RepID=UPI0030155AC4